MKQTKLEVAQMPDDVQDEVTSEAEAAGDLAKLADRDNPAAARKAIEGWLPNKEARRVVLELIAACISENARKPQTWGVTLHESSVALNVGGGYYVVKIASGYVNCYLLPDEGDSDSVNDDKAFLASLALTSAYDRFPDVRGARVAQADIVNIIPRLKPHVLAFVNSVVDKNITSLLGRARQAHSPGVLRYMEEELGIKLPNPAYIGDAPASPQTRQPRYWVGGYIFSNVSMLPQFLEENAWWFGYAPNDTRAEAVETRTKFKQIAIGDYFAIKGYGGRGFLKIHHVARVEAIDAEKQRLVLSQPPLSLPNPQSLQPGVGGGDYFGTLQEMKNADVIHWAFHQGLVGPEPPPPPPPPSLPPANVILYGPPGTGKTYNTIARAVAIVDGDKGSGGETVATGAKTKARWDKLRQEGRIEFVTFHQSYGYEDFVEGIRPIMDEDDSDTGAAGGSGGPRYVVADGVFKRIALRALAAALEPIQTDPVEDGGPLPFADVWELLQEAMQEADPEPLRFSMLKDGYTTQIAIIRKSGAIYSSQGMNKLASNRANLSSVYAQYAATTPQINISDVRAVTGGKGHPNYTAAIYNYIKSRENEWRERRQLAPVLPADTVPEGAAQDYLARGEASGYRLRPDADQPPFVLVIDEINRGNISKILGELITLIEDDKRIGGEWGMTVTLPHSREPFGAPRNLYLLGTMNTADKSIALVDVALRRRFEFEEMMPDFGPDVCKGLTEEMRAALNQLNRRITLRKDRDHQIGHAFFVRVESEEQFNAVFRKKILPLLQEYFHGDWDALRYVLGEGSGAGRFIKAIPGADTAGRGARNRYQWFSDGLKPQEIEAFRPLNALVSGYKLGGVNGDTGETVVWEGGEDAETENGDAAD